MKNIENIWVIISLNSLSILILFNKEKNNLKNLDEQTYMPRSLPCDQEITKEPPGKDNVAIGIIFLPWHRGSL